MKSVMLEFGKDKTAILKGIAIVMMIVLHCCCGPDWYDKTIPAMENQKFVDFVNGTLKICVAIYAFLVGFGYSFCEKRNLQYSLNHIGKLLLPYWVVLLLLSLPFGYKSLTNGFSDVILNMFGISGSLSWVNWFVYFYIFQMITMPFISRVIDRRPILYTFIFMCGYLGIKGLMMACNLGPNLWTKALTACCISSPIVLEGYLFGRMKWFTKIRLPKHFGTAMISCFTVFFAPVLRLLPPPFIMEWIVVPIWVVAVLYLFSAYNLSHSSKVLSAFGNTSVYMWFFHGLFFTGTVRWFWQRFILISDSILLIIIWTLLLSFVCSWFLKFVIDKTTVSIRGRFHQ